MLGLFLWFLDDLYTQYFVSWFLDDLYKQHFVLWFLSFLVARPLRPYPPPSSVVATFFSDFFPSFKKSFFLVPHPLLVAGPLKKVTNCLYNEESPIFFSYAVPQMHEKSHLACIQFVYGICCVRALNLIGALRLEAPVKILSRQHTNDT